MKSSRRATYFKRALLIAWGMFTLVLVLCIGILVLEMIQRGQNPLESIETPPVAAAPTPPVAASTPTEEILLYFTDRAGRFLVPDTGSIPFSDSTVQNCRHALNALIKGPRENDSLLPIISSATKVRALYLLDNGELVIDFSRELIVEHMQIRSASLEALLVYGIVQTLAQPALQGAKGTKVSQVRFLVEGAAPTFPAHIDVSEPIVPNRRWVATPESWQAVGTLQQSSAAHNNQRKQTSRFLARGNRLNCGLS